MGEEHNSEPKDHVEQAYGSGRNHDIQSGLGSFIRRFWPVVIIVLVILLVGFVGWMGSVRVKPVVECETMPRGEALVREVRNNPDLAYIERQVIITGSESKVENVADELGLVPIRKCKLHYLGENPDSQDSLERHFPNTPPGELTTSLYYIEKKGAEAEVIAAINQQSATGEDKVYADYNLVTGIRHGVCGNPEHSGEGSPFGGAPKLLSVGEEEAVKLFWEQWAFDRVGVGPALKDSLAGAAVMHQGAGVLVGVFDTSPFPDPWDRVAKDKNAPPIEKQEAVKWVNPAMDVESLKLKVSYPSMFNNFTATAPMTATGILSFEVPSNSAVTVPLIVTDVRDHGLFVTGLVHAVAPASEIQLIRVLNPAGCGDLFTLNEALGHFVGEQGRKREGTLDGVVINLSLGVRDFEGLESRVCDPEGSAPGNDIVSLCTTLADASSRRAVIVAAAGNASGAETEPLSAQVPAAFTSTIAVQATNKDGTRACFSNRGDVSAPGGNGGPRLGNDCASVVRECPANKDCDTAIIGPVLLPPGGDAYWPTHYAYWSGTSFAAPLVSGLVALTLEAGVAPTNDSVTPQSASSNSIRDVIRCGVVPETDGVINVPNTLHNCLSQRP